MFEDMKEVFSAMTGLKAQVNQADNTQTELLMKMCAALDSLPDRINGKSTTPKATPSK